jgi:hydroxymethylpyrimidine/phosphomethylpyrimidine kinase
VSTDRAPSAPLADVLICSAIDPSGGAGFLLDTRVVSDLGGRPVGVVTALTVQDTLGMRSCHALDAEVIGEQLGALLTDVEVRAVKLGILGSAAVIKEIGQALELTSAPVVWDPIGAPTQGAASFGELFETTLKELGRHLALITPNARELEALAQASIGSLAEAVAAGEALSRSAGAAVLVKGGHLGTDESVDVLCHEGRAEYLRGPRVGEVDVHGTGCALSSAIATYLALGVPMLEACRRAKTYVTARIANPVRPGRGAPAVL